MDLTQLTSEQFEKIVTLLKEKEQLSARLEEIVAELKALQGGTEDAPASGGTRRKLRDEIIGELQKAGAAGLTVRELAERLSIPNTSVHTWFHSTGKKHPEIKKIGMAQYAWQA